MDTVGAPRCQVAYCRRRRAVGRREASGEWREVLDWLPRQHVKCWSMGRGAVICLLPNNACSGQAGRTHAGRKRRPKSQTPWLLVPAAHLDGKAAAHAHHGPQKYQHHPVARGPGGHARPVGAVGAQRDWQQQDDNGGLADILNDHSIEPQVAGGLHWGRGAVGERSVQQESQEGQLYWT